MPTTHVLLLCLFLFSWTTADTMRKKACTYPDGSCKKNGKCRLNDCGMCKNHCICEITTAPFTPAKTRNDASTLEKIRNAAINATPAGLKDAGFRSFKDFYAVVPRTDQVQRYLTDQFVATVNMAKEIWGCFTAYSLEFLGSLARACARDNQKQAVQNKLLNEVYAQLAREREVVAADELASDFLHSLQNKKRNIHGIWVSVL
jgi:hypothetical protein